MTRVGMMEEPAENGGSEEEWKRKRVKKGGEFGNREVDDEEGKEIRLSAWKRMEESGEGEGEGVICLWDRVMS
ncbi:hypothetical protein OIU78_020857 [Salix suchowensis]|nr:hypothetical protein OIU78_020857 [Salix suchowensis]